MKYKARWYIVISEERRHNQSHLHRTTETVGEGFAHIPWVILTRKYSPAYHEMKPNQLKRFLRKLTSGAVG